MKRPCFCAKRYFLLPFLYTLLNLTLYGQISTGEAPQSIAGEMTFMKFEEPTIDLPAPTHSQISNYVLYHDSMGYAPRFGFPIKVNLNSDDGVWTTLDNGMSEYSSSCK